MGQLIPQNDSYSYLIKNAAETNSQPVHRSYSLSVCPGLCVPMCSIMYSHEEGPRIERVYRFMDKKYINVKVTRKSYNFGKLGKDDGREVVIGGELIYGYRIKYRHRSVDKIKSILFRKRMYGHKDQLLLKVAELKLLAVLETGPYLGTMLDGSDAYFHVNPSQETNKGEAMHKSE